jgi:hypothetical protein
MIDDNACYLSLIKNNHSYIFNPNSDSNIYDYTDNCKKRSIYQRHIKIEDLSINNSTINHTLKSHFTSQTNSANKSFNNSSLMSKYSTNFSSRRPEQEFDEIKLDLFKSLNNFKKSNKKLIQTLNSKEQGESEIINCNLNIRRRYVGEFSKLLNTIENELEENENVDTYKNNNKNRNKSTFTTSNSMRRK